jgi:hypothetical protein
MVFSEGRARAGKARHYVGLPQPHLRDRNDGSGHLRFRSAATGQVRRLDPSAPFGPTPSPSDPQLKIRLIGEVRRSDDALQPKLGANDPETGSA